MKPKNGSLGRVRARQRMGQSIYKCLTNPTLKTRARHLAVMDRALLTHSSLSSTISSNESLSLRPPLLHNKRRLGPSNRRSIRIASNRTGSMSLKSRTASNNKRSKSNRSRSTPYRRRSRTTVLQTSAIRRSSNRTRRRLWIGQTPTSMISSPSKTSLVSCGRNSDE